MDAKVVSRVIDVGDQKMTVKVEPFRNTWYLAARFMWVTPEGELAFGKNGVNVPLEFASAVIRQMIHVYNEATDSQLELIVRK